MAFLLGKNNSIDEDKLNSYEERPKHTRLKYCDHCGAPTNRGDKCQYCGCHYKDVA